MDGTKNTWSTQLDSFRSQLTLETRSIVNETKADFLKLEKDSNKRFEFLTDCQQKLNAKIDAMAAKFEQRQAYTDKAVNDVMEFLQTKFGSVSPSDSDSFIGMNVATTPRKGHGLPQTLKKHE